MNGRVYDYNIGRFMSVDPVIQASSNSQSINPYSYIMNNPLSGTDPTGYVSIGGGEEGLRNNCDTMCRLSGMVSDIHNQGLTGAAQAAFNSLNKTVQSFNGNAQPVGSVTVKDLNNGFDSGESSANDKLLNGGNNSISDIKGQETINGILTIGGGDKSGKFGKLGGGNNEETSELSELTEAKLNNEKLRIAIFRGLGDSKREVMRLSGRGELGLAIKSDGEGGYNNGKFPNNSPNTNVLDGLEDGGKKFFGGKVEVGGALGGLVDITDAEAIVIAVTANSRNSSILARTQEFQDLSNKVGVPVFVGGQKTKTFIFDGDRDPVKFNPSKH